MHRVVMHVGNQNAAAGIDCVPTVEHSQSRCSCLRLPQVNRRPVVRTESSSRPRSESHPASLLRQLRHKLSSVQRLREGVPARHVPAGVVYGAADDALGATHEATSTVDGARCRPGHRCRAAISSTRSVTQFR